ncbi:MAG TPA: hypothetical protein VNM14_06110 [Planctomycetota bacterium]|jgi:hypothetical protein|nr:hypothetical protein [Planctomycetota bacterium]
MRIAAFILLLAIPQDSADPYYKFAKGSTWSYGMNVGEDGPKNLKMKMTVTGEADGRITVDMAQGAEGGHETKMLWYVADGLLYWGEKKGDKLNEAIGIFKIGSKKGDTWSAPASETVQKHSATHQGREEVKVPAGVYKDAVHIKLEVQEANGNIQLDMFLVEKIGVVKMVYGLGEKKMSMDLEEFKPAK